MLGAELPGLDFVAIAQGQGCAAKRASDPAARHSALTWALTWALSEAGTTLVEVEMA